MGNRRSTKIVKTMGLLTFDLFVAKSDLLLNAFVWALYIYIGSIEVTCRPQVANIILIGNLRWLPSCLCLLYIMYCPVTLLFTCIKSWFFRNHIAIFHQISHWSYCWNLIDSLFMITLHWLSGPNNILQNYDELFISCDDRVGKMLQNIYISAVAISLSWASHGRGPHVTYWLFWFTTSCQTWP